MKTIFNRFVGLLLIVAAIIGLVFSISGIVGIWRIKPSVTTGLTSAVDLVNTSLDSTAQGLALTRDSMKTLADTVSGVQATLETSVKTFETIKPLLDQLGGLLENDLPNTVTSVQTSLDTAYQSAQIIDTVLHALTFFNRDAYNPQVPLQDALKQISTSMNGLPVSFRNMKKSLSDTSDQVEVAQADLKTMIVDIKNVQANLQQYDQVLSDYQNSLTDAKKQLTSLKARLPSLIDITAWVLTIFLIWMAIAQFGLLTQGWELMTRGAPPPAVAADASTPLPPSDAPQVEDKTES